MAKINKAIIFLAVIFSAFLAGQDALAAKLYISPQSGTQALNKTFSIDVKIDSQGDGINAAQSKIIFPQNLLEVKSIDKGGSVFSFWPDEPSFSNEGGTVNFIGGTVNGVSGASLQVLKINFYTKSAGDAQISLDDSAVTSDDGTGTNILTDIAGANFRISATTATPSAPPAEEPVLPGTQPTLPLPGQPIPPPTIIEREPVPAKGLPDAPNVSVSLYPNSSNWYNISTPFSASWPLPLDIIDVSTAVNANPNFEPQTREKLFDSEIFGSLSEGISYLHVRFRNNIGWGPTAHYRLAIDTTPPAPLTIESPDGFRTDNPKPLLNFETQDALSGINYYLVKIGEAESFEWKSGQLRPPLQAPGTHKVTIRAIDLAGNGTSNSVNLEILPIESPVITFTTEKVFFGAKEGLVVKGTSLPVIDVRVFIEKEEGGLVAEKVARSDKDGNWDIVIDEPFGIGIYVVSAQSRDSRGALSSVVKFDKAVIVKSQPIIKLGAFEIGAGGSAFILLLILIAGFGVGYWYFTERQARLSRKIALTGRDTAQLQKAISDDLEKLLKRFDEINVAEQKFIINRIAENIKKIEKYILKEIEEINK